MNTKRPARKRKKLLVNFKAQYVFVSSDNIPIAAVIDVAVPLFYKVMLSYLFKIIYKQKISNCRKTLKKKEPVF